MKSLILIFSLFFIGCSFQVGVKSEDYKSSSLKETYFVDSYKCKRMIVSSNIVRSLEDCVCINEKCLLKKVSKIYNPTNVMESE